MPPEPLPWDRRDFRKHERSGSDPRLGGGGFGGGGGPHRWREQQHIPNAPPAYEQQRWYSDFRSLRLLPPGHGKLDGWYMYSDDTGQGFLPLGSHYADRNSEDENCRPFGSRGDGRYCRNNRENRDSFIQKGRKAPSWEPAKSPSAPAKPITEVNNLRSIENTQQCSNRSSIAYHLPPNSVNLSEQSQCQPLLEEKSNKNGGIADETTGAGQESEKENCLGSVDWKPLKFAWLGSLSSRGSCFSHSSSSKSVGMDSAEIVAEVQPENATLSQSPADDTCVRSTSPVISDEAGSRKKLRLGWGEGLAKYEKKKVEGPEDGVRKNEPVLSVTNTETLESQSVNLPEKSHRVTRLLDYASPGTPSSVACSSSPGVEEKEFVKEANVDHDVTNLSCSPSIASNTQYDAPIFNLENLELASIANLSSLINELLQSNDPTSAEKGNVRTTSMNKLLIWKVDALKALEMTESEIESLETELKSLIAEPRICCPAGSSSLPGEEQLKPCEGPVTASKCVFNLDPLQIDSSREIIVENAPVGTEDVHVLSKDEDIDSPGSATSKFVEVLPAMLPSETAEFIEGSKNLDVNNYSNLDEKCLKNGPRYEENSWYVDNHVLTGTTSREDLAGLSNVHCDVDNIYDSIFSSNRDAANIAMEQLNKLLPEQYLFDSSIESSVSSLQRDPSIVKEKFLMRKRFLRFKEKVLTLKFKVFQHFSNEGQVVSIRKLRGKTRKKFDPSQNGHKRNHSSLHSRVSSYAGGPQIVPADEVIAYVNDLLSESAFRPYRNTLKMPPLILDKAVKMSTFISNNGLVEDPCAVEKERSVINPWTSVEKEIFIDKLAAFGKDFSKIASFLDHKTVADCIEFYYKNHKSKCFEKTRKNPGFLMQRKSQSITYLVASGKRWNPELNATSLDILGAASEIAANIDNGMDIQLKSCKAPRGDDGLLLESDSTNTYDRETEAADVLASICGSLSSEAVSSCITSSVDHPGDGYQDPGGQRISSSRKRPLTPEVTQDVEDECSDESCGELNPTDWSDEEKSIFIQAVSIYGKDFAMISQCVETRSMDQCKLFFSKARKCLGLDLIQPGDATASGDVDGGGSDIEDGFTVETCSVICNNSSECKMEEDLPPPDMKLNHESDVVGTKNLVTDFQISEGSNELGPLDSVIAEPVSNDSLMFGSEIVVVSSNMKSERGVEEEDDHGMPNGLNEAGNNKALVEVSDGHCGEENQREGHSVPSDNKIVEDRDANSSEVSEISSGISETKSEPQPSTGDCQQHLLGLSLSDSLESSQILWGYPVSVQTMKEINGDVNCEKLTALQNALKRDGSRQQNTVVEAPFPSLEQSRDHSRHQSGCSSTGDKPSRNRDVKLFGTILVSSQQKTNNSAGRTNDNSSWDHKIGRESLNLKLGAGQTVNCVSVQTKLGYNNYIETENIPVRSFGFWDGNRIQTGIPPLPDSALLLAKYPSAFSNYATRDLKLEQPPLHGMVRSSDRPVTVYPSREVSISNGLADYRGLRNRELQPFTIDMKHPQNVVFSEMQRRNGFDLASGMHSAVGRGGVFAGGQCSNLSDPVAAMKMHYAKAELLRMQGGNIIKEVDRWMGRGVGR